MPASHQPDPVSLVAGPELEPCTYRCPQCRRIDLYSDRLPTGGTACLHCGAKISLPDVVVYARVRMRLLALLVDVTGVFVTTGAVWLFVGWIATSVAPRDIQGHIVPEAVFWITVVELAIALMMALSYLIAANARGASVAKRALGLAVVDATTGDRPRMARAVTRTEAQILTVLTLGLGYAVAARDPRHQTLHDRIANTIVVET